MKTKKIPDGFTAADIQTESSICTCETPKAVLNEKLRILCEYADEYSEITVTYFVPDKKKSGGEYVTVCVTVRKFDNYERKLILQDGTEILFEDITELDSELFNRFDIE
ncbi:MAG: hypothetical protein Q4G33_00510 [bacterium]|nr:hypothetical protein [bacterium]